MKKKSFNSVQKQFLKIKHEVHSFINLQKFFTMSFIFVFNILGYFPNVPMNAMIDIQLKYQ